MTTTIPPVDLGRLFGELPTRASRGWTATVVSDDDGNATSVAVRCNDAEQQADVIRAIEAGVFAPVIEDEAEDEA